MRTHSTHTGEAPVSHPRAGHARVRYLEVPGKADAVPEITQEQIARRAYELYLARGGGEGDALSDWLAAERELKGGPAILPPLTRRPDAELAH